MSKLRIIVAIIITVIWAAGYSIAFFDRSFTPPPEISGLMLGVITWLFSTEVRERLKNGVNIKIGGPKNGKDKV